MRKHFLDDFNDVFHLNLQGNVRHDPTRSGSAYNVFGIQVGVGITIAIRHRKRKARRLQYREVRQELRRHEKLADVANLKSVTQTEWQQLQPDSQNRWLVPEHAVEYAAFLPVASKEAKATTAKNVEAIFKY